MQTHPVDSSSFYYKMRGQLRLVDKHLLSPNIYLQVLQVTSICLQMHVHGPLWGP